MCSSEQASHGLQDFKEAARLAAEAKAKAAEADGALAKAEALREQASGMASEEAAAAEQLRSLEGSLASVQHDHALASWRLLKVSSACYAPPLQQHFCTLNQVKSAKTIRAGN